jgi:hypothetical protein
MGRELILPLPMMSLSLPFTIALFLFVLRGGGIAKPGMWNPRNLDLGSKIKVSNTEHFCDPCQTENRQETAHRQCKFYSGEGTCKGGLQQVLELTGAYRLRVDKRGW